MERIVSPSNYPPSVGKLRPDQIAQRSTWTAVPDPQVARAAMHVIHVVPLGASTVTHLNPTDPASDGYLIRPGTHGDLYRARPGR